MFLNIFRNMYLEMNYSSNYGKFKKDNMAFYSKRKDWA